MPLPPRGEALAPSLLVLLDTLAHVRMSSPPLGVPVLLCPNPGVQGAFPFCGAWSPVGWGLVLTGREQEQEVRSIVFILSGPGQASDGQEDPERDPFRRVRSP